ncbi:MAG: hypothetical protein ACI9XO_001481 [Paraglaciecola sp.]|jgi:hypothetical protein
MKKICFLILGMYILLCFYGCVDTKDKEIHLIPEDFLGIVYIIYNQEDGVASEYSKSGRRIYRIPPSGILKTQLNSNPEGFIKSDMKFYFTNDKGQKIKELPWFSLFASHHSLIPFEDDSLLDSIIVSRLNYVTSSIIKDSLNTNRKQIGYTAYVVEDKRKMKNLSYPKLTIEVFEKETKIPHH